jgi:hypothetical protein
MSCPPVSTRLPLDVKHLDYVSLDIEPLSMYSFDIKKFELKRLDGKGEQEWDTWH